MKELDSVELSKQLKKPSGDVGLKIGEKLNSSNKQFYDFVLSNLSLTPGDNLLEVGFGNGKHFSRYFELELQINVTGVDYSPDMCREAQQNNTQLIESNKLTLACSDARSMPFPPDSFDFILGLNIIYFLDPVDDYLKEIRRVLRPDGKLIIGYRPRKAVEHLDFTKQNFILYEPDELKELMENHGFIYEREEQNHYEKQAADGSSIEIVDHCLICRKGG